MKRPLVIIGWVWYLVGIAILFTGGPAHPFMCFGVWMMCTGADMLLQHGYSTYRGMFFATGFMLTISYSLPYGDLQLFACSMALVLMCYYLVKGVVKEIDDFFKSW